MTRTAAGRSAGRRDNTPVSASWPPADAAMATTQCGGPRGDGGQLPWPALIVSPGRALSGIPGGVPTRSAPRVTAPGVQCALSRPRVACPAVGRRDIIVIGGSAGAVRALDQLVRDLPADFPAAL